MKRNRSFLEKELGDICLDIIVDTKLCNKIYDHMKDEYDIPKGITSDMICLRISMSEVSEFVLFCLASSFVSILNSKINIDEFYTKQEINQYSKSKYEVEKIKFPLRFKMIQVKRDQWIGSIDNKMVMKLRGAQLINYNANAQRVMSKIIKGDKEIYKISLNQTAVNEIKGCYKDNTFIPNTITLNIPIDGEDDFYYDKENCELVINKLEHFHILDAYHRYIALCKCSDADKNFNYDMELRIVNWDDMKAQTFIWQEDKKTPLKKVDSNSLNMNNPANIIVSRLNEDPMCNIKGLISRNDGIINYGEIAQLIRYFYFKGDIKKEEQNRLVIKLTKELRNCFNMLTEYNEKFLVEKYTYKEIVIVIYMFHRYGCTEEMCKYIDILVANQDKLNNKKFYSRMPRRAMVNEIENIFNEVI